VSVISPLLSIFSIIILGFITQRFLKLEIKPISDLGLYVLTPSLVFYALTKNPLTAKTLLTPLYFMILFIAILWFISGIVGRVFRLSRERRSLLCLVTVTMNCGNLGIPLILFSFGEDGLDLAVLNLVVFLIPFSSLSIYLAASGRINPFQSVLQIFRIPIIYAVFLAFALNLLGIQIPREMVDVVKMLGMAVIPVFLLVLGMQLSETNLRGEIFKLILSSSMRLLLSPIVALLVVILLQIKGLPAKVLILQTSTPTAVIALIYAIRYNNGPEFVAGSVVVSTLLSLITLAILMNLVFNLF